MVYNETKRRGCSLLLKPALYVRIISRRYSCGISLEKIADKPLFLYLYWLSLAGHKCRKPLIFGFSRNIFLPAHTIYFVFAPAIVLHPTCSGLPEPHKTGALPFFQLQLTPCNATSLIVATLSRQSDIFYRISEPYVLILNKNIWTILIYG